MANTFLNAERDRWPLWLPVALGIGAGGYFALPVEPSAALGWSALGLALTAAALAVLGQARWPMAFCGRLLLQSAPKTRRSSRRRHKPQPHKRAYAHAKPFAK